MPFGDTLQIRTPVNVLEDGNGNRICTFRDCNGDLFVKVLSKHGHVVDLCDSEAEVDAIIDFLTEASLPLSISKRKKVKRAQSRLRQ